MTAGPGKYDHFAMMIQEATHANGVIIWVDSSADQGAGFAVAATLEVTLSIPSILRETANQIEADIKENGLALQSKNGSATI
jgi:hypothetical protein